MCLAAENGAGLCFADVSTGEFHVTLATGEDVESKVINQLSTYSPKEVIFGGTAADYDHVVQFVTARLEASASTRRRLRLILTALPGNYRDLEEG